MKSKQPQTSSLKRYLRLRRSSLKKKFRNSLLESWKVKELQLKKLRLYKFPKHFVTPSKKTRMNNRRVLLSAPTYIDYYNRQTFDKTNKFIADIVDAARNENRKVFIDFSQTEKISAAAMLSLLAEVDVLTKQSIHGMIRPSSFGHRVK